uniref:Ldh family oxidoreductase n=1 Tax=Pararhizobium sp. IMCC3301 TaxID=3067904 RepID=UPI0027403204|nr:Ldh family oxidoreductase [Pararhizobium sp. IMCC3301]
MSADLISAADLQAYLLRLFDAVAINDAQARSVVNNMVWSELVGRANFGVIRIPVHLQRLQHGVLNAVCHPQFTRSGTGSGLLDGDNGFGYYAGELAMKHAIQLARDNGIGIVGVRNSNFFGTGAYFANQAAESGMISLVTSNSFPKVAAHGGLSAVLGTNPFAFGAPRANGDHLLVDFATSSLAGSTVRAYLAEKKQLPEGLAIMPDGTPARDPALIGEATLLPFGGAKGYGLSLMVEILSGILTGAGFSHQVKSTYSNFAEKSDSGHCMIAIDIEKFMPLADFLSRFEALIALLKASNPVDEVLLPGEIRWANFRRNSERGLEIPQPVRADLTALSANFQVPVPWK